MIYFSCLMLCSVFYNNTGSAVLLRNSLLYLSGEARFAKNKADVGAAINIQEGSRVSQNAKKVTGFHCILLSCDNNNNSVQYLA